MAAWRCWQDELAKLRLRNFINFQLVTRKPGSNKPQAAASKGILVRDTNILCILGLACGLSCVLFSPSESIPVRLVLAYLAVLLAIDAVAGFEIVISPLQTTRPDIFLALCCSTAGLAGGLVNCLRSVYLNACVYKQWDPTWHVWYYLRPILSSIMGLVAFVFIRAGLVVFGSSDARTSGASIYGYLAVCFIAGYNVRRFLERIEGVSEASFGIKKKSENKGAESQPEPSPGNISEPEDDGGHSAR